MALSMKVKGLNLSSESYYYEKLFQQRKGMRFSGILANGTDQHANQLVANSKLSKHYNLFSINVGVSFNRGKTHFIGNITFC
jgi:hypothetical protein